MNKYYMTDHEKRQHAGQGSNSFVCNVCYARKQNEYLLKKHMQQHVRSTCVICEIIFNSSKNLNRHVRVHQIQRCDDCGKNFNAKRDLRVHKKDHKKKAENLVDFIEGAEFIFDDADNLRELGDGTLNLL